MKEGWTVLYDGHCKLCSRSVRWIIRNDVRKRFKLIPLQATPYHPASGPKGTAVDQGDTVILIMNGKHYRASTAFLKIVVRLRFPWPVLGIFYLVPPILRDPVYQLIARNRKRWFGEEPRCYIP